MSQHGEGGLDVSRHALKSCVSGGWEVASQSSTYKMDSQILLWLEAAGGSTPDYLPDLFRVPQGSALRPVLFLLYIKAATVPLAETQQSQGNNSSETSSPFQDKPTQGSQDGSDWTLVTPRRRKLGRGQGPKVPPPPYFRMPFHFTYGHLQYSKSTHRLPHLPHLPHLKSARMKIPLLRQEHGLGLCNNLGSTHVLALCYLCILVVLYAKLFLKKIMMGLHPLPSHLNSHLTLYAAICCCKEILQTHL